MDCERLDDALDHAGILHREEPFRDDDVQQHGQRQRERRATSSVSRLMVQHPGQRRGRSGAISRVEAALGCQRSNRFARSAGLVLQQLRAQHRHQRQRHHRRDHDGHRQRDGEFAEQPPDHVAHEQQRDQHRDQRDGQRDDGEADLLARPSAPPPAASRPLRCSGRCSRSSRSRRRPRSRWRWSAPSATDCRG